MSAHTKEPWRYTPVETEEDGGEIYAVTGANIVGADNECIFRIDLGEIAGLDDPNARRIVACVNACADVTNEQFVGGWTAKGLSEYAKRLEQQREELLSALVGMVQEPQPLGIDRATYQTALALVIKHHDNVDSPEAWAARKATT